MGGGLTKLDIRSGAAEMVVIFGTVTTGARSTFMLFFTLPKRMAAFGDMLGCSADRTVMDTKPPSTAAKRTTVRKIAVRRRGRAMPPPRPFGVDAVDELPQEPHEGGKGQDVVGLLSNARVSVVLTALCAGGARIGLVRPLHRRELVPWAS